MTVLCIGQQWPPVTAPGLTCLLAASFVLLLAAGRLRRRCAQAAVLAL